MPPPPPSSTPYHRPHSATVTRYDLSTKQYRIPQPQTYNKLKRNINRTLNLNKSAAYQDILQLTNRSMNSLSLQYHNKIQQLCTKYCIKRPQTGSKSKQNNNNHLSQSFNSNPSLKTNQIIDADNIAKQFIQRKSLQKQFQQRRNYLNQQIKQQSNKVRVSTKKIKTQEFFKFTCENLQKLQKRQKQNKINQLLFNNNNDNSDGSKGCQSNNQNTKKRRLLGSTKSRSSSSQRYSINNTKDQLFFLNNKKTKRSPQQQKQTNFHPYLKIYQQSQKQALQLILNNNTLNFNYDQGLPVQITQTQQWEKYQKSVKGIYSGIKRMRYVHSAREMAKSGRIRAQSSSMQRRREEHQNDDDNGGFYIT